MKRKTKICLSIFLLIGVVAVYYIYYLSEPRLTNERIDFNEVKKEYLEIFDRREFHKLDIILNEAEGIYSDDPDYWNMLGAVSVAEKEYARANRYFQIAIDKGGGVVSEFNLAEVNFLMKNLQDSRDQFYLVYKNAEIGGLKDLAFFKFYIISVMLNLLAGEEIVELQIPSDVSKIAADYCRIFVETQNIGTDESALKTIRSDYVVRGFGAPYEDTIEEVARW